MNKGYLCGKLLAYYENIHPDECRYWARKMGECMDNPKITFKMIDVKYKDDNIHINRIKDEIGEMPERLNKEQQSAFSLGYYHNLNY